MFTQFHQPQANFAMNIGLHVLILFTFLTVFYFVYISKLTEKTVKDSFDNLINSNIKDILTQVDTMDKKSGNKLNIDWVAFNNYAKKLVNESQGVSPEIESNNKLKFLAIGMIVLLVLVLFGLFFFFKWQGYRIKWWPIIKENLIIFSFVGVIEFLFFQKIAAAYIPVTPDFVATSVLERIKSNIYSQLN